MHSVQLPWALEEDILSLLPLKSLVRFRSVCKRWNALINDTKFINNHLARARPHFVLFSSSSNIYSVEVNINEPSIELHNLPPYFPGYGRPMPMKTEYCDGLLVHGTLSPYGVEIWNPWLRQITWIKSRSYFINGMGYDNSRSDKHYKLFGFVQHDTTVEVNITELGSDVACKSYEFPCNNWRICVGSVYYSVSLDGTLYWIATNLESRQYFIQSFDFSAERFKPVCVLPSKSTDPNEFVSLAVFKRDRFSFLEQKCYTRDIKVWVTKDKIKNEDVEWIKFMDVSIPDLSRFRSRCDLPSYFIDDKSRSLVLCCIDEKGKAYVAIARGDMFHEIRVNDLVGGYYTHRTYFPSLVPVPMGTNDEATFMKSDQRVRSSFQFPSWLKRVGRLLVQENNKPSTKSFWRGLPQV